MPPRGNKRRQSRAAAAVEELPAEEEEGEDPAPEPSPEPLLTEEQQQEVATAAQEKEHQIWDTLKEEHFETIEQLPLSLHRQFILMRELDEQANGYQKEILPALQAYIQLRHAIQASYQSPPKHSEDVGEMVGVEPSDVEPPGTVISESTEVQDMNGEPPIPPPINHEELPLPHVDAPPVSSTDELIVGSTVELLSRIAYLSDETSQICEEKYNLAQACYDSVDRHIKLIDQAIKEQEAAIELAKKGTQQIPLILPELIIPQKWRQTRAAASSSPPPGMGEPEVEELAEGVEMVVETNGRGRKGRKGRGSKAAVEVVTADAPNPIEPTYCYCQQVSYGEMIGCDNSQCETEWFHMTCVGLLKVPSKKQKWYCPDCRK